MKSSGRLRSRLDTRQLLEHAIGRVRAGLWPAALAAIAAASAWLIAHRVLGHAQPFFAPIAAAISLSISPIQRSRRIVQMVAGVLLGIGIGELLVAILGTATVALGVIVLLTLSAALLSGEGVFGEGMMFANQAAASAILVVTLHRAGTGSERLVDALVGGAVALVLGVILFPAHPMVLLFRAERTVLQALADLLEELTRLVRSREAPGEGWALQSGQEVHAALSGLARARSSARANVRVAPRRFRLRTVADAETQRTARLDLLGNAVLSLVRAAITAEERGEVIAGPVADAIASLAGAASRLAEAPRPLPARVVEEVHAQARRAAAGVDARDLNPSPVVTVIVRAVARDLENVLDGEDAGPERSGTTNVTGTVF